MVYYKSKCKTNFIKFFVNIFFSEFYFTGSFKNTDNMELKMYLFCATFTSFIHHKAADTVHNIDHFKSFDAPQLHFQNALTLHRANHSSKL